jgi:hypothetical protein
MVPAVHHSPFSAWCMLAGTQRIHGLQRAVRARVP